MIIFSQNLTEKELSVLIALQENPLATFDWLSERVGLAKSIVFGIMKSLSAEPKPHFYIAAFPHLRNLGLENIDVIVKADNETKIQLVEKLSLEHPFTYYRARSFGETNGLLVQFNTPINSTTLIDKLFYSLKSKNKIDDYEILPFAEAQVKYTHPNVDYWNPKTQKWDFDWKNWFSKQVKNQDFKIEKSEIGSVKSWLTISDIAILKELVKNARRKNLDIIDILKKDGYEITPQTFSRRLKKIAEECVKEYRVFLNPRIFDLYSTVLVSGKGEEKTLQELYSRVIQYPIPFSSTFKIFGNNIFWYLHLPPTHLSDLLYFLRPLLKRLKFNHIDYIRSKNYIPWPLAFDENNHDWIKTEEFMVNDILKRLNI